MPSNAEILAQLEKLAEAQKRDASIIEAGGDCCWHVAEALGAHGNGSRIMKLVDSFSVGVDFPAIFSAFKRLVKIEEAAEDVANEGSDVTISHLRAALKEPQ